MDVASSEGSTNMSANDELQAAFPGHPATVHSCHFCSARPLSLETFQNGLIEVIVLYSYVEVRDGAWGGCLLFREALTSLESGLKKIGHSDGLALPELQPELWKFQINGVMRQYAEGTWISEENSSEEHSACNFPINWEMLAYEGDPIGRIIPYRPFCRRYDGEEVLRVKQLIASCEHSHRHCNRPTGSFVPTRLLKIYANSDHNTLHIRLCTSAMLKLRDCPQRYATLSYCWGGPQKLHLNANSENFLESGLAAQFLPKTLHDAVQVTWDLGIEFLWVDSLCIRQDDPNEVASEISQMHLVYGNSFFTISASRSRRCDHGFLHPYSLPRPKKMAYKLPCSTSDGEAGSVILFRNAYCHNLPIDSRGWALQEHLLARRLLRFTDFQMHWSCQELSQPETQTLPRTYKGYEEIRTELRHFVCRGEASLQTWREIVTDYSQRRLTDPLDKLPAISAIAQRLAQTINDQYIAGLWMHGLPWDLFWTCRRPSKGARSHCAPSWSWASCNAIVDSIHSYSTEVDPLFRIESCIVKPRYAHAPYGALLSGSLVVHGRLQEGLPISAMKWFDFVPETTAPNSDFSAPSIYCLLITACIAPGHLYDGLMLIKKGNNDQAYERI